MNDMPISTIDPQQRAERSAEAMYARDTAAVRLGITLEEVRPGYARMRMAITENMLNGHDICHGGYVFTLADTAFAYACNSYNKVTVAAGAMIDFLAPGRRDDALTAVATEQALGGKTGVYDVVVTNQNGKRIALFRGKSHRIQGTLFAEPNK